MKLFSLFLVLLTASLSHAAVWQSRNTWTPDSEKKFADFIENRVHADIFVNPKSPYNGISTDCADAIYVLRAIFAYENELQFAMRESGGGGKLITSNMTKWDSLSPEKRLRSFLTFVRLAGTTQTLPNDTYPIEINKTYVTPGVVFLNTELSGSSDMGHVEFVKSIDVTGYLSFMSSTAPEAIRKLNTTMVNTIAPQNTSSGFRRFKQPQDYAKNVKDLPGYSTEQFRLADWTPKKLSARLEIFKWHEAVRNRLRDRVPTLNESMGFLTTNICNLLRSRVPIVKTAWDKLQSRGGQCFADAGDDYDNYSTPERDTRIFDNYALLEELLKIQDPRTQGERIVDMVRSRRGTGQGPVAPRAKNEAYDMSKAKDILQACQVEYSPGEFVDAYQLYRVTKSGHLESDPNYNIRVRWGVELPERVHQDCR
ncbi:MAG: hypothetical protein H7326_01095 [Bdellovibrionaceae bacterium]|nr:hypothetical protein [Pseudobdellovibrionaceae bacterium]